MSIRPEISGFKLQKFYAIFGSKNEELLKELLEEDQQGRTQRDIPSIKDDLNTIIMSDQQELCLSALAQLEVEKPELFINLASYQDGVYTSDSNMWKSCYEYFEGVSEKVSDDIKPLINYFIVGRMFFIPNRSTTSEFSYAYLLKDEVKIILDDMEQNWSIYDDGEGEFGRDFKEWLKTIHEKSLDLFFYQA
jgi:hypothetical protein